MKVVIVHDISLVFGGAERVLVSLLRMYPRADVYISFASQEYVQRLQRLTSGAIILSPWNYWVRSEKIAKLFKPFIVLWWRSIDLSGYNLVIASSHSYSSKSVLPPKKTAFIAYIHTPPRYLWGIYNETQWINHAPFRMILSPIISWMRRKDIESANNPHILIANSKVVQNRILHFYHRKSIVVYPPVYVPKHVPVRHPEYYLCVSRLVKQKGVDIAIKACNQLHQSLVIVGSGSEEPYLKGIAGPTIKFFGFVPDAQMPHLYAGAKALLHFSTEEDFGISPVEAMAYGVPVIASDDGGVAETVLHGKTGLLFHSLSVSSAMNALQMFETRSFLPSDCRNQAKKYSENVFQKNIFAIMTHQNIV